MPKYKPAQFKISEQLNISWDTCLQAALKDAKSDIRTSDKCRLGQTAGYYYVTLCRNFSR
jgi:hypothetical protein